MRKIIFALSLLSCFLKGAHAQKIERVEPLNWWIGMNTPLQLMFYGPNISEYEVDVLQDGVSITKVHQADSPNYLFVDVEINDNAKPGEYTFRFSKGKKKFDHPYSIEKRRENSARRTSFSSADLVYLVMPDRFANGDTSNDSTNDTAEKAKRKNMHGRHGGDIRGIINRLGYMKELGVTALWSTPLLLDNEPIFSYHGYACSDYYHIDPRYGTNELYREMVKKAHENGIKVIMDVVTNHCGTAHWWMKDLPFNDWVNMHEAFTQSNHAFAANGDPNASKYDLELCTDGWFDTSMPDMRTENPYLIQYFRQVFSWWVEWADLDGLRVDTYPYNEKYAMAKWTKGMIEEYPNLNIVGECWKNIPAFIAYWDGAAKNKDGFTSYLPSVMDFSLQEAIRNGLASTDTTYWGQGMMQIYNSLAQDALYNDPRTLMIFLDNHDTDRFADQMNGNPDKIKLGLTLLATMRGVPQLYYGTEVMLQSVDMKEGHGGARVDFPGGWADDKKNLFENTGDMTADQKSVYEHAKKLFNWRKETKIIHEGKTMHFFPYDNIYSFFRYNDDEAVFVLVNASEKERVIDWKRYEEMTSRFSVSAVEVISGKEVEMSEVETIPALTSLILQLKEK